MFVITKVLLIVFISYWAIFGLVDSFIGIMKRKNANNKIMFATVATTLKFLAKLYLIASILIWLVQ